MDDYDLIRDTRDGMVKDLAHLPAGSDEILKQAQAIKIISEIDLNDRKLEFDIEKEETRKVEKSNEYINAEYDRQLTWIDRGIKILEAISNPGASLIRTFANNRVKIKRDIMGYTYEETGVIGSHTFNNALKDKYD